MKKQIISAALLIVVGSAVFAAEAKADLLVGTTALEQDAGEKLAFGGAYVLLDASAGSDYFDVAGKVYYRLNSVAEGEKEKQKLEIKKAFVKLRPFGTQVFELAIGKLYSYYLPGAYFSLAEVYTGASRWGQTGVGLLASYGGFTAGVSLPLTESYVGFDKSWGIHAGLYADISTWAGDVVPVKTGVSLWYDYTAATASDPALNDIAFTLSALWSPKYKGFVSKVSVFGAFTYNANPYVASSVFKNVSNYAAVGKSNFGSLNAKATIGKTQLVLEAETGKSLDSEYVPLYAGVQVLVPIVEHLALKPRFLYYGALNAADASLSRNTFEAYPRLWLTFGKQTVSLGARLAAKETDTDKYEFEWSIPLYYEIKFGK